MAYGRLLDLEPCGSLSHQHLLVAGKALKGDVGGSTASHALTLGATESLYKHSLVEPCNVSDLAEILQSFFLFSVYCPVVVSALRQRQELGRGQSFLCHTRFCTTDRIYIPERCPSYLTLSRAINDIDFCYLNLTTSCTSFTLY